MESHIRFEDTVPKLGPKDMVALGEDASYGGGLLRREGRRMLHALKESGLFV